jgi:2-C-methyl-D-erythritol 4-phosphate cytidylyltransferase
MNARNDTGATVAVVLGAGQGTRMGAARNKIFLDLGGQPILARALAACDRAAEVDEIVLVAHPREVAECRAMAAHAGIAKLRDVIPGGASRHQSEWCALTMLRPRIEAGQVGIILIHDGARPFVSARAIAAVVRAARRVGGALLALPLDADEVVAGAEPDGTVSRVFPPGALWRAQTPQAFRAAELLAAYEAAARDGYEGTDTAAPFERAGSAVQVVRGSPRNLKITTPADLARAKALLHAAHLDH